MARGLRWLVGKTQQARSPPSSRCAFPPSRMLRSPMACPSIYRLSDLRTNCRESKTDLRLELHFRLEFGAVACCKGGGAPARWDPGMSIAFALRSQDLPNQQPRRGLV